MAKSKYRHLFFDLDHTLWDFEMNSKMVIFELFEKFDLQHQGVTDAHHFFKVFSIENEKLWAKYRNGQVRQEDLRMKRFYNSLLHFKKADVNLSGLLSESYIRQLPEQERLLPFAKEILDYCKSEKYEMHIITNGFDLVQHQKMERSGIQNYFSEVITSERCMSLKPKKAIFDYALQVSGASIEESIMIGDNWEADIQGAMQAGWEQIYYNPFALPATANPTYEIRCLSELKNIL